MQRIACDPKSIEQGLVIGVGLIELLRQCWNASGTSFRRRLAYDEEENMGQP